MKTKSPTLLTANRKPAWTLSQRPCLVFAYADSYHASRCARLFRRHGWEVHLAGSAVEAVRAVRRFDPQVVVLEVDLPDENGWQTCARITEENTHRKVILLASEMPSHPEIFLEAGASLVLSREESLTVLAEEVESLLATPAA